MSLEKFDHNMLPSTLENEATYDFYNASEAPFRICGLIKDTDGVFRRIPDEVAKTVSEGVVYTNEYTAGGRFIFRTNARKLAIKTSMPRMEFQCNVNFMNCCGMDIYKHEDGGQKYLRAFIPRADITTGGFSLEADLLEEGEKDVIIYTSAHATLKDIFIGVPKGCFVREPKECYTYENPVVFYGSSITQGTSASRSGVCYPTLLSQTLDFDFINLGFAGNGKAEKEIANYVSNLSMSAFVYDYDHNAPTVEYLRETHERMYLSVRRKHPHIPIIMMSRPQFHQIGLKEATERFEIIKETYDKARLRGENVYIIDGRHMYDKYGYDNCLQDNSHPNTLGMFAMYEAVLPILKECLK
ncbi:MAG: hypothetical protein IJZ81_01655 [Clostridia bacterium]|nr:hypothetical protein [Clostridia bacterium]